MVGKRRLLLSVATALTLVVTAAAPMAGATKEAKPQPLRSGNLLRVKDIAANGNTGKGQIVAVGWHEGSKPGQLYLAFSIDGGEDYRRTNGNLRRYPILGLPSAGMSLAICSDRVWAGTALRRDGDRSGDSDVFLTTRTIGGGADQAFMTTTSDARTVRNVSVSCAGNKYIAIGWLNKNGAGKTTARLMIRSTDQPSDSSPAFEKVYNLGVAEFKSGLDVAATPDSVAVSFVRDGDLRFKRYAITPDVAAVNPEPLKTIVWKDVKNPRMAAKSKRLVVAYSDAGKVKAKVSKDLGATFSSPSTLVKTGGLKNQSRPYSVDVVGDRIVATATAYSQASGYKPQRIQSQDFAETWRTANFGNKGARYAALLKKSGQDALLMETWHNNAPKGSADTLRARYELQ